MGSLRVRPESILVCAVCLTPFTALRFGLLGLGEVLIIMIFFLYFLSFSSLNLRAREYPFSIFWAVFFSASLLGGIFNWFIAEQTTSTANQAAFDFAAYLFVLGAVFCFESMHVGKVIAPIRFARRLTIASATIFGLLLVIALFRDEIFGVSLFYYRFFSPFAENPHQMATFLLPMPFIAIFLVVYERTPIRKALLISSVLIFSIALVWSGSSKAALGLISGFVTWVSVSGYQRFGASFRPMLVVGVLCLLIAGLGTGWWIDDAYDWFQRTDTEGERAYLYSHGYQFGLQSPLVGRGPGPHLRLGGVYDDAHQTPLTVFLQAGVIGLIAFSSLMVLVVWRLRRDPALLGGFVAVGVYIVGGDVMRRFPIWVALLLLVWLAPFKSEKNELMAK